MKIKFTKLNPSATVPEYAYHGDASMDLFCAEDVTIEAHKYAMIPTGIAMEIPDGYVGLIWDRSSLPVKFGLTTMAGVIDSGYRGEIKVVMLNTTDQPFSFKIGDKLAQMLIQPVEQPSLEEVKTLSPSERGEKGWGSTGMGRKHR